jgi:AcrR family transcriptional regulator
VCSQMARKYELKRRAERVAETRRRIVEAAVDLHTTLGPAQTSISAIADRAGVQRHTVYAHFPDLQTLFAACSGLWGEQHPFPDADRWFAHVDPEDRLRAALGDVYTWYDRVEPHLALFARDASLVPEAREVRDARAARLARLAEALAAGLPGSGVARPVIGHALEFETWRSLCRRQGLPRETAVDLMVRLAASN